MLVVIVGITLVLHRCVLLRQLRQQASTDGKTGLLNADAWQRAARRILFRIGRLASGGSLLIVDLDHFKAVNDRYGHPVGDEVLRAVAETLRAELRTDDLIGRFGGEEFTVLLAGEQPLRVTASIGIAEHPTHGSTVEALIRAADSALYDAKAAGRDRTRVAWQRALESA